MIFIVFSLLLLGANKIQTSANVMTKALPNTLRSVPLYVCGKDKDSEFCLCNVRLLISIVCLLKIPPQIICLTFLIPRLYFTPLFLFYTMKNLIKTFKLYLFFLLLVFLSSSTLVAQPQLLFIPNDTLMQGNEALSFGIYLNDPSAEGGYVPDVFGVRFKIKSSIGYFPGASIIDVSQSALGQAYASPSSLFDPNNPNNGNNGVGNGSEQELHTEARFQAPEQNAIDITIIRTLPGNGATRGKIADVTSVVTIDDLESIVGQCAQFSVYITNVELITKLNLATLDITDADSIVTLSPSSFTVEFCPKCELSQFNVATLCSPGADNYYVSAYFAGDGGIDYSIFDNYGNQQISNGGLYGFGPYPNDSVAIISVLNPNNIEVCSLPTASNCSNSPTNLPTCYDGIENQDETGVDCGGSNCSVCLSCDLQVQHYITRINAYEFMVDVVLTGSDTYIITDNYVPTIQSGVAALYAFGPYNKYSHLHFDVTGNGINNCSLGFNVQFSDANAVCTYQPPNDECSGAVALQVGSNGPYDNYCSTNNNTDPISANCLPDRLTNTVWYSFVGNGQQMIIYPKYCGGGSTAEMSGYENDLQMLIYTNCPAETGSELVCSDDVLAFQPRATLSTVAGQTYYVLIDGYGVYDAQGEFCIELENCPTTTITPANVVPSSCSSAVNGRADMVISGTSSPYTYQWSNGATTQNLQNLHSGTYTITVSDSKSCTNTATINIATSTDSLNINMVSQVIPQNIANPFYYNQATLSITNGVPSYSYNWYTSGYVRISGNVTNGVSLYYGVNAQWAVTVTDAAGCQNVYSNIAETPLQLLTIDSYNIVPANNNNGAIDVQVVGGMPPYTYLWSNDATTANINNVGSNWYAVTVTDSSVPPQQTVSWYWLPTEHRGRNKNDMGVWFGIQPNPVQNIGQMWIQANADTQANVELYNTSGQLVTSLFNHLLKANEPQNTLFDTNALGRGVYIAKLTLNDGTILHQKMVVIK